MIQTSPTPSISDFGRRARGNDRVSGRLTRKHILMLALAIEVFGVGVGNARRYSPPGIAVEEPSLPDHAIA